MNRYLHYAVFFLFTLLLVGCADAGKDQEVASGALVTLDGNASKTDVYGQIREYRWKQIKIHGSVPKVQLSDKNAISPTFTAPTVTKKTILTFRLTTKEVGGYYSPWKSKDEVNIFVSPPTTFNKPPQAVVKTDHTTIKIGQSVTLDASTSSDSDGEIVSYEWSDVEGNVLGSEVTLVYTFASVGTHEVKLKVTDDGGESSADTITITVNALQKPIADINVSATVVLLNDSITFDANGSRDNDGEIVSYQWTDVQGNVLSDIVRFTKSFSTSGEHNITLSVMDDDERISTKMVSILAEAELLSVSLASTVSLLEVNETTELNATAHYNDDTTVNVSSSVEWIIGDTSVLSVDSTGKVLALNAGITSIKAKVGEVESNSIQMEVIPLDTTAPVITLNGDSNITLTQGENYEELGATATDDRDGNVNVLLSGSVDTSTIGVYTITYSASDKAENESNVTRTVNVILPPDITPPVISLSGEATITLHQGTQYIEQGATATDDRDTNVPVNINGTVNTSVIGQYTVTYTAIDNAGNSASRTRTIIVIDVTPPVITLNGESNITLEQFETYVEQGATALDAVDGSVPVEIVGTVDSTTVGTYVMTYNATDKAGNESNITRNIVVIDVTPPVITLNGDTNMTLEQDSPYVELGATALDAVDGNVSVDITGSVDVTKVGVYTITYRASDSEGNQAQATREIKVIDITPPVITLNGDSNVTLYQGDHYEEFGATATDNSDGNLTVEVIGVVNTATLGSYVVTYSASDSHGNSAQIQRNVYVVLPPDVTPPVITLNGDSNITFTQGENYEELGATATDDRDGDVNVTVEGEVDSNTIGVYTITYSAKDSAGNEAQAIRSVNIVGLTATLILEANATRLNKGEKASINVVANYSDGTNKDVTSMVDWNISVPEIVKIESHTLTSLEDHPDSITLNATMNGESSNSISVELYWEVDGHRLPPLPDPKVNHATLLGIDSNENGVRDDVERWIYDTYDTYIPCKKTYFDITLPTGAIVGSFKEECEDTPKKYHSIVRAIAMQKARASQIIIQEPEKAKDTVELMHAAQNCSFYFTYDSYQKSPMLKYNEKINISFEDDIIGKELNAVQFNTVMRARAYGQYNHTLSGGVYGVNETDQELRDACDFDVDKLLGK